MYEWTIKKVHDVKLDDGTILKLCMIIDDTTKSLECQNWVEAQPIIINRSDSAGNHWVRKKTPKIAVVARRTNDSNSYIVILLVPPLADKQWDFLFVVSEPLPNTYG